MALILFAFQDGSQNGSALARADADTREYATEGYPAGADRPQRLFATRRGDVPPIEGWPR
jgi:hypothetical protein